MRGSVRARRPKSLLRVIHTLDRILVPLNSVARPVRDARPPRVVSPRSNPRKSWYQNLAEVTIDGDSEASFHLKRPQPSFIGLLASGWSPVYPCHVAPREMRQRPIGTGPFKFVEFKPNESIKLARNPDYWKPGRPYLDGIEYTIIRNASTAILALGARKFDRTGPGFVPISLLKEIKSQAPEINCEVASWNTSRTAIINRAVPPFDNPELRRAIMLTLDRKAFIDIIGEGQGEIGATMQPPPDGVWGMPATCCAPCRAMIPTSQRIVNSPGRSCKDSATLFATRDPVSVTIPRRTFRLAMSSRDGWCSE